MDSDIGNISCKAGEILPCTSYLLLAGVGRENGKTKEREKEKRRAYNANRGTSGEALSSPCYCIVTYEWRLEVFGVTRNLIERSASLHKHLYT